MLSITLIKYSTSDQGNGYPNDDWNRPTASEVLIQLERALEFQEDYEIWEPKLPIDYKHIIRKSIYDSIKMKKDLYDMFSKGILLQDGKVLFSLGSNGERNEMISARMFSYKVRKLHKWRVVEESSDKKYTDFEVLLESFSRYHCGNGSIFVEGIEFRVIDNVKIEEIEEVQQIRKSNSNKDQLLSPNEVNRKIHFMLSEMEVLYDPFNVKHFHLQSSAKTGFQEAIELLPQQIFNG
ncbi:hypothetical protein L1987_61335 [Smallanthus sonchifolius]|uniref:Uncharacterized protein n=1 Tax=Smallanthus sonchifolius TaxID=185202 RepID=A0ACB9DAQ4_9ASTR|nr:hypothetical protein L1987_61335 [Smallanthus sonchifolius]